MQAATRQEQKVVTRDRLVNAAMALFARKGIMNTTTADVAKSVRMSHGVVFLHFPTRDDLVIAVIDEFGRQLAAEFRQAFEQEPQSACRPAGASAGARRSRALLRTLGDRGSDAAGESAQHADDAARGCLL